MEIHAHIPQTSPGKAQYYREKTEPGTSSSRRGKGTFLMSSSVSTDMVEGKKLGE
jgi:hypothetical protein